jgi:hypothetical protein
MLSLRRALSLLGLAIAVSVILFSSYRTFGGERWRHLPQSVGLGETVKTDVDGSWTVSEQPEFVRGTVKSPGSKYSKTLVVARTKNEDTRWTEEELSPEDWQTAVYVVDDPNAPLHPPKNKGHEVMVYLTYIIDHYDNLTDITVFLHSHRIAWHNEEIFDFDAVEMLRRLSAERVTREGYMNLRCYLSPGCPDWMHPGAASEDGEKKEEVVLARSWGEIFPHRPIPAILAQPCCAQFALSRERIRALPRSQYIHYRDWMLQTDLRDTISGRVWEYLWHVVFTGESTVCPAEDACLCDGYGLCLGGPEKIKTYRETQWRLRDANDELGDWESHAAEIEASRWRSDLDDTSDVTVPELSQDVELTEEIEEKYALLRRLKITALDKGAIPYYRAISAGRAWKNGDGF